MSDSYGAGFPPPVPPGGPGAAGSPPPPPPGPSGPGGPQPAPGWPPRAPGEVAGLPGWDPPEPPRAVAGWSPPPPTSYPPPAPNLAPGWAPPPPAGPAWGPPAGGFGAAPGRSLRTVVRHRPGLGLALAVTGLVLLGLSLTSLPWVSVNGEDVSLSDIRDAFDKADQVDSGGGGSIPTGTVPPNLTVPPATDSGGNPIGVPVTPPPLGPAVSPLGLQRPAAVAAQTSGRKEGDFIKTYAQGLWLLVLGWAAFSVVFATLVVPGTTSVRGVLGFLMAGPLGLAVGLVDDEGTVGMRVCGALGAIACAALHFIAVEDFFPDKGGPSWAYGLWASLAAFLLIVAGCAVGTRQERLPAPP